MLYRSLSLPRRPVALEVACVKELSVANPVLGIGFEVRLQDEMIHRSASIILPGGK